MTALLQMKSILPDPNNHVPPVSPGDGWDDAEGFDSNSSATLAALPPRRVTLDKSASPTDTSSQVGLRIDGTLVRDEPLDSATRLEVLEHKGSVVKLDQPVEAPPKVLAQIKFHERPKHVKVDQLQGEGGDWGDRHRFSMRWIIGLGLGIAGLVVLSISLLPSINASNASRPGRNEKMLVVQDAVPGVVIPNLDFLITQHSAALATYHRYLRATQITGILPLVRDSTNLAGFLTQQWRPRDASENSPVNFSPDNSTWETVELGGKACGILRLELPDSARLTGYFIREGEELRMDWKATFAYGTATFEELASGNGDATEVRGSISRADFYSAIWPENEYQSYRFLSPHDDKVVWVYARREGPVAASLISSVGSGEITGDTQPPQKVTLHLEPGPDGSSPNQWLIREVLQIDWLTH